jgi:hypothetical protein
MSLQISIMLNEVCFWSFVFHFWRFCKVWRCLSYLRIFCVTWDSSEWALAVFEAAKLKQLQYMNSIFGYLATSFSTSAADVWNGQSKMVSIVCSSHLWWAPLIGSYFSPIIFTCFLRKNIRRTSELRPTSNHSRMDSDVFFKKMERKHPRKVQS